MIRSQILYSRLVALGRGLHETVGRTTRSRGLAEAGRYAAALVTGDPKIAVQHQRDAAHLYLIRSSVAALLDNFAFDLADGDIVVVGDPFSGGSTPQTLTVAAPLFHEGDLVLFPAVRAEMADLAGEIPGSLHPAAAETWQEAIRVTPVKLYRHGVLQRDVLRFLLRNSRAESLVRSDLEAIVAGLRATSAELSRALHEHGTREIGKAVAAGIEHSERLARAHLARWQASGSPGSIPLGEHGEITAGVQRREHGLHVDFSGTGAQVPAPFNMTLDHARGYVLAAAAAEILDDMAVNDGVLNAVTVEAASGSLLSAVLPAATGLSDRVTGHAVSRLIQRLLEHLHTNGAGCIDGPAPTLVVFEPIGSSESLVPMAIEPGFALSAQGWGSPVLAGRRLLPSAEILEARDGFELLEREFTQEGGLKAILRNRRGALQAVAVVPRGTGGEIRIETAEGVTDLDAAVVLAVPDGALIHITYPSYAGRRHEHE